MKRNSFRFALLMALAVVVLIGCSGTADYDLSSALELEFSGLDTEGVATLYFDNTFLVEEVLSNLGLDENFNYYTLGQTDPKKAAELEKSFALINSIALTLDRNHNLSNGDEVKVNLVYNEALGEELKYRFGLKTETYKVSGLREPVILEAEDLLEYVEAEFLGIAPNATVELRNTATDDVLKHLRFYADRDKDLDLGETIEVFVDGNDYILREQGYVLREGSMEFTVENVDCYVASFEQLDQETLGRVIRQSDDLMRSTLMANRHRDVIVDVNNEYRIDKQNARKIENISLDKAYFLTHKDPKNVRGTNSRNALLLCYTFDMDDIVEYYSNRPSSYEDVNIYAWAHNFVLTKEGDIAVDVMDMEVNKRLVFTDPQMFFDAVITSHLGEYEYEEVSVEALP